MSYESRTCNPLPMFGMGEGAGTMIHGTEATLFVNRSKCLLIPAGPKSTVEAQTDRKSTRLNSSHPSISYAVFCLKKKKNNTRNISLLKDENKGKYIKVHYL